MRAAIFVGQDQPASIEDVTPVDPGPGDVVVRIGASGVCHSDLSVLNGTLPVPPPVVLGHEGAGTVEWVGKDVSRVRVGDRVIASLTPVCGSCWHCVRGESHLCEAGSALGSVTRVHRHDGSTANALSGLGTFADVMTSSQFALVPVHTDLPDEQLALIGCGVTTGVGAALNTAQVFPGATVAVIGCGGVGTAVIQGARIAGAARIMAIDPVAAKREAALGFGATDALDPSDDPVEQVKALTGGRGVDFAFEVVGFEGLMQQAVGMTRRGGTTVLVGVPRYDVALAVPVLPFILTDRTIKGSYYGSAQALRDFPRFIGLIESGRLDLGSMVSQRLPLDRLEDAFESMRSGSAIRSVVSAG
ncbi:MAG: Alcohol dehydrogenase zinc-binding domain protein [Actinomycetia bacterium]|nr:Alcohol dehydrogenase zinc-binding domain protein [Actinomycetes bacterium]